MLYSSTCPQCSCPHLHSLLGVWLFLICWCPAVSTFSWIRGKRIILCSGNRFLKHKDKDISSADNLLMMGFLVIPSEVNPNIFSDRFLWPGARFQWEQFRNVHMLLNPKLVMLCSLTNATNETTVYSRKLSNIIPRCGIGLPEIL